MKTFTCIVLSYFFIQSAVSQSFTEGFNFYLPPQDTGSSIFLPQFPAKLISDQDFVSIDAHGHFSVNGKPIRFFGTNLVADGAFPIKTKAWFIAGRLRKMGFNLVRFHHLDNPWSDQSLFERGKDTRHLLPATLDRLDYIIAELKKNNIYIDMNLHVGRTFTASDGVADYDSLPEFGKVVNYFDPQIIALHKEYAKQLLSHRNPYTGSSLSENPVMAMVEITNENSLYRSWRDGALRPKALGGLLTIRHTQMLDSIWNMYLKEKYRTTDSLRTAWDNGLVDRAGTEQIHNGSFEQPLATNWVLENDGTPKALAFISNDSVNVFKGTYSGKVDVQQADGTDWHLQFKQVGLTVRQDSTYTIWVAARSDSLRTIECSITKETSPWTWYGGSTLRLSTQWNIFSFTLHASETILNDIRLSFSVGAQKGKYWFDEVSFTQPSTRGLLSDESLESASVQRIAYGDCSGFSDQRVKDISSFYLKTQTDYYIQMRTYLKDSLGVKVPIVGTNWNVGAADLSAQASMDYVDNHSYWDHPSFPTVPWSSTDWLINNTPMVTATDGGTVGALMSGVPMKNKPFTISEYNHAFPNRYQTEGVLFLSSYASFHSVDGLMFFDYNGSWDDWETDKVNGYFNISRNTPMMSLMPSCAYAYRNGFISAAKQTLLINYTPDDYLLLPKKDGSGWEGPSFFSKKIALTHAIRAASYSAASPMDFSPFADVPTNPYISDTKEITWNTDGIFTVAAPSFVAVTGFLNSFDGKEIGPLTIQSATDFGTITWLSLTDDSLMHSSYSLLTVSSRTQNIGMAWDGVRTVHNQWGQVPTVIQPLEVLLRLAVQADSISVVLLDPYGMETQSFSTYVPVMPNVFDIPIHQTQPEYRSPWFGIRKYGKGIPLAIAAKRENVPPQSWLEQNYPNPFNPTTVIRYQLQETGFVSLKIYDLLGKEVVTLVNAVQETGSYSTELQSDKYSLTTGIYFYRLQTTSFDQTKKLVIVR